MHSAIQFQLDLQIETYTDMPVKSIIYSEFHVFWAANIVSYLRTFEGYWCFVISAS